MLPSMLESALNISVYLQRAQVTVEKRWLWMSNILVRKPPVARNWPTSYSRFEHLGHVKFRFSMIKSPSFKGLYSDRRIRAEFITRNLVYSP